MLMCPLGKKQVPFFGLPFCLISIWNNGDIKTRKQWVTGQDRWLGHSSFSAGKPSVMSWIIILNHNLESNI